jgi:hypothetical protein
MTSPRMGETMQKLDSWVSLALFGAGILAGIVLITMLPGMPWSAGQLILDLPRPTDQHDLAAQRSMAAAAWYMVALSAITLFVGGVSLYYLRANLRETRSIGEAQVRAYMIVTGCHSQIDWKGRAGIFYAFKNSGETPAHKVSCTTTIYVDHLNDDGLGWRRVAESQVVLSVRSDMAGQKESKGNTGFVPMIILDENAQGAAIWNRSFRIIARITLSWTDVFGREHVAPVHYGGYGKSVAPPRDHTATVDLNRQLREDGRMDFDVFD